MELEYLPISWGGLRRGQCIYIYIYDRHGVFGIGSPCRCWNLKTRDCIWPKNARVAGHALMKTEQTDLKLTRAFFLGLASGLFLVAERSEQSQGARIPWQLHALTSQSKRFLRPEEA